MLDAGSYQMIKYNGESLPHDLGPLPPKGSGSPGCNFYIAAGELSLSVHRTFSYRYDIVNGCTNRVMSRPGLQGTYSQEDGQITFVVTRVDGIVTTYNGS